MAPYLHPLNYRLSLLNDPKFTWLVQTLALENVFKYLPYCKLYVKSIENAARAALEHVLCVKCDLTFPYNALERFKIISSSSRANCSLYLQSLQSYHKGFLNYKTLESLLTTTH